MEAWGIFRCIDRLFCLWLCDSDGDGIGDGTEKGAAFPTPPVDTDGDGTPDYKDKDSDDDGIPGTWYRGFGCSFCCEQICYMGWAEY